MPVHKKKNSLITDPNSCLKILDKSSRTVLLWCVLAAVIPTEGLHSDIGPHVVRVRDLVQEGRVVSRICEGEGVCLLAQYQT